MSDDGRSGLRRKASQMLVTFLARVEKQHGEGPVDIRQLSAALQGFLASPAFAVMIDEAFDQVMEAAAREVSRNERADPFHRLLTEPLADAFATGLLSRDILPNYCSFLRLVLGDLEAELTSRCVEISDELQDLAGSHFSWDRFYDDPRAKRVLWTVLARIAETFRRFDARRDWFITLMQNRMQAVSLAQNAFLPRPQSEEQRDARPFGAEEFNVLFGDLFGPLRRLSRPDSALFTREFGRPVEEVFGRMFADLAAVGAAL